MVPSSLRQLFARFSALVFASSFSLVATAQTPPDEILLKDYKPRSIFKIRETRVEKARYPVIDVHSHDYAPTGADVDRWVNTMDAVGLEKTIILSGSTGARFVSALAKYGKHPKRFSVWCGIDFSALRQPGFGPAAVAELERCHKAGAMGVGELGDKGRGLGATSNALERRISGFVNEQPFADLKNASAANIQFVGLEANTGNPTFFAHANYFRVTRLAEREPRLTAQRAGTNLLITWPANANFFLLQQTPSLNPFAPWANVWTTNVLNGVITVTNPIGGNGGFLRLREL